MTNNFWFETFGDVRLSEYSVGGMGISLAERSIV